MQKATRRQASEPNSTCRKIETQEGLKIATDTVANATNTSFLVTKNSGLVAIFFCYKIPLSRVDQWMSEKCIYVTPVRLGLLYMDATCVCYLCLLVVFASCVASSEQHA